MAFSVLGSGKGKVPKGGAVHAIASASSEAAGSSDVDGTKLTAHEVLQKIKQALVGAAEDDEAILTNAKRTWKKQGAEKALTAICPNLHKARTDPAILGLTLPSLAFEDLKNPIYTADFIGNLRYYINGFLMPNEANASEDIWTKMGHHILGQAQSGSAKEIEDLNYFQTNFPQYNGRVFLGESFGVGSGNDIFNIISKLTYCGKKKCDWSQAPNRPKKGFSMNSCKTAKAESCTNFKTFLEKVRGCKFQDIKGCILYATALGGEQKQKGGYYTILKQAYANLKGGSGGVGVQKKGKSKSKGKKPAKTKSSGSPDTTPGETATAASSSDDNETLTPVEALEKFADVKNFEGDDAFASDKTVQHNFIGAIVLVELLKRQALAETGKPNSKLLKAKMKEILADAAKVLAEMKKDLEDNQSSLGGAASKLSPFGGFLTDAKNALVEGIQEAGKPSGATTGGESGAQGGGTPKGGRKKR